MIITTVSPTLLYCTFTYLLKYWINCWQKQKLTLDTVKGIIVWPALVEGRKLRLPFKGSLLLRRSSLQHVITQEHLLAPGKGHGKWGSVQRA